MDVSPWLKVVKLFALSREMKNIYAPGIMDNNSLKPRGQVPNLNFAILERNALN